MDKEKILQYSREALTKLRKWFFLFREYCNYYTFSTGIILTGIAILIVNHLNIGFYNILVLGTFFIALHFFFNRNWFFSFIGSFLLSIGAYIILLLSHILPDGGEVVIVLAIGVGFLVFYGIEGKWLQYWPLIPGSIITVFGILVYLHQTQIYNFGFLPLIYRYWPFIIVLFGLGSLFSRDLKKRIIMLKNKIPFDRFNFKK